MGRKIILKPPICGQFVSSKRRNILKCEEIGKFKRNALPICENVVQLKRKCRDQTKCGTQSGKTVKHTRDKQPEYENIVQPNRVQNVASKRRNILQCDKIGKFNHNDLPKRENIVQVKQKDGKATKIVKRKCTDPPECENIIQPKKCKKNGLANFDSDEEDGFIEIGDRSAPRKRRNPSKWKKNIQAQLKRDIYECMSSDSLPDCNHKRGPYRCCEIKSNDIAFIRKIFAGHKTTVDQNRYILMQVVVDSVKRHRPRNNSRTAKSVAPNFFLRMESSKRIRVCKNAFITVLGVGRGRLTRLISFYNKFGEAKHESRGGDHKVTKFGGKRNAVVNFIKKLKARESHYGRNKSCRLYLPHELKSIKNLCRIYNLNREPCSQVKYGFFKYFFKNRFNLAFGTPRTDVCSFCLRYKHLLLVEKDIAKKQMIRGQLRTHKLRAKAYYKLLKERKPWIKAMAGDCEQNQAMPKIPDQASYFSRQLNFYNFTIAEAIGKNEMKNFGYVWTEDQAKKGSNEIASAVYHKLLNTDFDGTNIVRLFADGCGGQNKNVQMLCMSSWWLVNKAPKSVKGMQLVFPVTGHSFLPPDRVFGRIEKDIRKEEEILSPTDYHKIIEKHETIVELGKDWKVYDWKKYATERFKSAAGLPFKISKTKIFNIRKSNINARTVEIKAETNYRNSNSDYEAVCKTGMNLSSTPELVKEKVVLSQSKLDDVSSLLKNRFGTDWKSQKNLSYFKKLIKTDGKTTDKAKKPKEVMEASEDEGSICSCCDEDDATFFL